MSQQAATITSLAMAFEVVKAMQADGLDWGEGYRPIGPDRDTSAVIAIASPWTDIRRVATCQWLPYGGQRLATRCDAPSANRAHDGPPRMLHAHSVRS